MAFDWETFELLDDLALIAGVIIAVFTPYWEIGIAMAAFGLILMWAKGEIG